MRTAQEQGALGEQLIVEALKSLPTTYHAVHNLVLRMHNGSTTQIDHVLVSPFGVFVIEAKKYKGTIIAAKDNRTWFQLIGTRLHAFRCPTEQNQYHIRALARQLPLPSATFQSVVERSRCAEWLIGHGS